MPPGALKPVSYDPQNRELRSVRFYFFDKDEAVLQIRWKDGVKAGAHIQTNEILFTIVWEFSADQDVKAPAGCNGIVQRTNRRISYDELDEQSQWLLELERV